MSLLICSTSVSIEEILVELSFSSRCFCNALIAAMSCLNWSSVMAIPLGVKSANYGYCNFAGG